MSAPPDVELAVRVALHFLERASNSCHNGNPSEAGSLHWPIAVAEARRALIAALETLANRPCDRQAPPP